MPKLSPDKIAQVCHSAVKKLAEFDEDYKLHLWDDMDETDRFEWISCVNDRMTISKASYPKSVKGLIPRQMFRDLVSLLAKDVK